MSSTHDQARPAYYAFGRRLQEIRREVLRLSAVEDLAPLLRCSTRTLENYEQGRSLPTGEAPWLLFRLIGPEHYASLAMLIPGAPETVVRVNVDTISGPQPVTITAREERLRELIALAQQVLDER